MSDITLSQPAGLESQLATASEAKTYFAASEFAMWLFLATEILLFGGLFVSFTIMHWYHPEAFAYGHRFLSRPLGALNTIVLLTSSFAMVMGVNKAELGEMPAMKRCLWFTIAAAVAFLCIHGFEYADEYRQGLLPGRFYRHSGVPVSDVSLFFGFDWGMTALHAFHILCGIGAILWLLWRTRKEEFCVAHYTPVEMVGLYWHLIDVIWIFLFPLLYLIG